MLGILSKKMALFLSFSGLFEVSCAVIFREKYQLIQHSFGTSVSSSLFSQDSLCFLNFAIVVYLQCPKPNRANKSAAVHKYKWTCFMSLQQHYCYSLRRLPRIRFGI